MKCMFCPSGALKEVSREEFIGYDNLSIQIVYKCNKCGREPMVELIPDSWYDEDDNYIEV